MLKQIEKGHSPLVGIESLKTDKSLVQKSSPLLSLWRSSLTLAEFKILDAYLARIDSHDPGQRWVQFSKGELEDLLAVSRIHISDLKMHMKHLMTTVEVEDADERSGFHEVALFEEAVCRQDEHGRWQIDLQCTAAAMKYVFNIDNLGYLRYKLRSIIALSSRYSYLLFLYLERNRFRGDWAVPVDALRQYLGCREDKYQEFRYFNRDVLKRAQSELFTKTPCRFTYEPLRRGRSTYAIHFTIDSFGEVLDTVSEIDEPQTDSREEVVIEILRTACLLPNGTPEFSTAEIKHLRTILIHVPSSKMPFVSPAHDSAFNQRQYLSERYAAMNRHAEKHPIHHRFEYLLKMIKKDAGME